MDNIIREQQLLDVSQFKKYFIVKIAGKGNINQQDSRYKKLKSNLPKSVKEIEALINKYNYNNKEVIIIWDGDNYQGKDHEKPSPFTDIILSLHKKKHTLVSLKLKKDDTNPWKQKHLWSWKEIDFGKYYTDIEPHIENNKLCDIYVSYGSSNFKFRDDDKLKGETSGYLQLKEFKKRYKLKKIFDNKDIGFEVYLKHTSLKVSKKKKKASKKKNIVSSN